MRKNIFCLTSLWEVCSSIFNISFISRHSSTYTSSEYLHRTSGKHSYTSTGDTGETSGTSLDDKIRLQLN